MGFGYNGKRTKNIFDPNSSETFTLSRSKIDMYFDCPRCFYLDRRLGVDRPPPFPFSLNNAVDELLKKEFDSYREKQIRHPLVEEQGVDAIPFSHYKLEAWRDSLRQGVSFLHEPTNFLIRGGIDDVWVDSNGKLIVVDYKATSKRGEVGIDAPWQDAYKRQIEIYQWLFRMNGFEVSNTGYFVYVNGKIDAEIFGGKLDFDVRLIPYVGSTDWVEQTLFDMRSLLESNEVPNPSPECAYCKYREAAGKAFREHVHKYGTNKELNPNGNNDSKKQNSSSQEKLL